MNVIFLKNIFLILFFLVRKLQLGLFQKLMEMDEILGENWKGRQERQRCNFPENRQELREWRPTCINSFINT